MTNPQILVTFAAGRTGSSAVLQLLVKGFPVRAFVRKRDFRTEHLEKAGAELAFGDLFDFRDIRKALVGVQRAYHCPPFAPNLLEGAMLFALAAEEAKALGATDFEISQIRHYADALRHGAFELGAPTSHVELITGQKPESFETIARRYLAEPSLIHRALSPAASRKRWL